MERLAKLLKAEMEARKLSVRAAAKELGIAYNTVTRILAALPVDIETTLAVCDWLGVTLADVVEQKPNDAELARRLAVLINREPELGAVFTAALQEVDEGTMDAEDLRDIIEYATFKLEHRRVRTGATSRRSAGPKQNPST